MTTAVMSLRSALTSHDPLRVCNLVEATGAFRLDEVRVAGELAEEWLAKGAASGYRFLLLDAADRADALDGYVCFGPTPCTVGAWDVYWLVVHPARQREGAGRVLWRAAMQAMANEEARVVYAETSSAPAYAAARRFYIHQGGEVAAIVRDFYTVGEDKILFSFCPRTTQQKGNGLLQAEKDLKYDRRR